MYKEECDNEDAVLTGSVADLLQIQLLFSLVPRLSQPRSQALPPPQQGEPGNKTSFCPHDQHTLTHKIPTHTYSCERSSKWRKGFMYPAVLKVSPRFSLCRFLALLQTAKTVGNQSLCGYWLLELVSSAEKSQTLTIPSIFIENEFSL